MESANQIKEKLIKQYNLENLARYDQLFYIPVQARGDKIYKENKIKNYKYTKNTASCTITGTEKYNLSIKFDKENNITNMKCTCEHFKKGNNCKHLYALLLKSKLSNYYDVLKNLGEEKLLQYKNVFTACKKEFMDSKHNYGKLGREKIVEFIDCYKERILIKEKNLNEDMYLFKHLIIICEIQRDKQMMINDYNTIENLKQINNTSNVRPKTFSPKFHQTDHVSILGPIFFGIMKGLFSSISTESYSDYAFRELKEGNPEPYANLKGYLPDNIVEDYPIDFDDEDYYN